MDDSGEEASIRRDGRFLVINRNTGITSLCAHCGSTHDLVERTTSTVWRNPLGCYSTLGLVVAVIVLLVFGEYLPSRDEVFPWVLVAAGLAAIMVNIRWRSVRVNLIYSLCLACRARRGRWIGYWMVAFLAAGALSYYVHPATALLLLPMYVLADRLQPAALRPVMVTRDKIWVRGIRQQVRERFPTLEKT